MQTRNIKNLPFLLSLPPISKEVIYDNMDEEAQKWMLDNTYSWFEK